MHRIIILLTVAMILTGPLAAQSTEDSVKATVNRLFEGMRNADAALLRSAFTDSAILQTIARNKEGQDIIHSARPDEFANFVDKQEKGVADEQIQFETIKIDGPLAMVWTPYTFYFKGKRSHCGVNSFQLVRMNGAWKIQYLIDTRRKNCD
mgnify:CR=1 FL=1|jgi:Uncharacterized protein conserved in bacteria with a cystatin-like fold